MPRAAKPCTTPGCPALAPCPTHTPTPWATSTRRTKTTNGWQQQRDAKRILARHHNVCHICSQPGANIVDHVIPLSQGGADTDRNKRPAHQTPCHQAKTASESHTARQTGGGYP